MQYAEHTAAQLLCALLTVFGHLQGTTNIKGGCNQHPPNILVKQVETLVVSTMRTKLYCLVDLVDYLDILESQT